MISISKHSFGKIRPSWLTLIAGFMLAGALSFLLVAAPVLSAAPSIPPKENAQDLHHHKMLTRVQWIFGALTQTPDHVHATPINTTLQDFHLPGTQSGGLTTALADS